MAYVGQMVIRKLAALPYVSFRTPPHIAVGVKTSGPNWLMSYTEHYKVNQKEPSDMWKLLFDIHNKSHGNGDSFMIETIDQAPIDLAVNLGASRQMLSMVQTMHFAHMLPLPGASEAPSLVRPSQLVTITLPRSWQRTYRMRMDNPIVCTEFIKRIQDEFARGVPVVLSDLFIEISIVPCQVVPHMFDVLPTLFYSMEK